MSAMGDWITNILAFRRTADNAPLICDVDLVVAALQGALPGQYAGTTTNDDAAAGNVGEIISSNVTSGAPVALTTGVDTNLTSITLTPGDWDVNLNCGFTGNAATTVTSLIATISLASATIDTTLGRGAQVFIAIAGAAVFTLVNPSANVPPVRMSVAVNTTVFAAVRANFAVNSCSVFGLLKARRVR